MPASHVQCRATKKIHRISLGARIEQYRDASHAAAGARVVQGSCALHVAKVNAGATGDEERSCSVMAVSTGQPAANKWWVRAEQARRGKLT